jgi:hypothetical protein
MEVHPEDTESDDDDDIGLYLSSSSDGSWSPALNQSPEPLPEPEKDKNRWLSIPAAAEAVAPSHDIQTEKNRWLNVPTWTVDGNNIQTVAEQVAASLWKYCTRVRSTFYTKLHLRRQISFPQCYRGYRTSLCYYKHQSLKHPESIFFAPTFTCVQVSSFYKHYKRSKLYFYSASSFSPAATC